MNIGQKNVSSGTNGPPTVTIPDSVVGHYPLTAVLVVFGFGLGIGVALGSILGGPVMPRPSLGRRTGLAAEKLGRQMLDALSGVLPESLSKHIS